MGQIDFSVSCREKECLISIEDFLNLQYPDLDKFTVSTVFGFTERTTLYGGRVFGRPEISDTDVEQLYRWGIGLKLPLSNHFVTEQEYEKEYGFLEKYHRKGNAIVLVNNELAAWIKRDFPEYELEASVIKNIDKQKTIDKYLDIYDVIVLPMNLHRDPALLGELEPKHRLRLFVVAACAFNCPAKICYKSVSKINKLPVGIGHEQFKCSRDIIKRPPKGFREFEINQLIDMGYTRFKLTRNIRNQPVFKDA